MKRLYISVAILFLLAVLSAIHIICLRNLTDGLITQLNAAAEYVTEENWPRAQSILSAAMEEWESRALFLHTTLYHDEIDAIRSSLWEASAFLGSSQDKGECLAVIARLINQLELLAEEEIPSVQNLL
ncbi:MAG: DUF4363 family protein [Oscillospiraceae bacterium]|nr:DUF4363 family protein [Oscillospiraceae bacterium]